MKKNRLQKGFALVLVLLFTAITLVVVTSIATALVSNIKLINRSKITVETYNLARGSIEAALGQLRVSTAQYPTWPVVPDCNAQKYYVYYYQSGAYVMDSISVNLSTLVSTWVGSHPTARNDGFYAVRLCPVSNILNGDDLITGIGFFKGQKLTFAAKVFHQDTYLCDHSSGTTDKCGTGFGAAHSCLPTDAGVSNCLWNHTKDKVKIYQTRS